MTFKTVFATASLAILLGTTQSAHASVLYSNPYDAVADAGHCEWSTTCASERLVGDDFAAQAFSLSASALLTSVTFTELDFGDAPSSVNWGVYTSDGVGGLPGTVIYAGSSSVSAVDTGSDASGFYDVTEGTFELPSVSLSSGSYYLALQGVTDSFYTYLAQGVGSSGAAESTDGGDTWAASYEGMPSVAISISGLPVSAAPEPSTWTLMIVGVGVAGAALRRRFGRLVPA